MQERVQQFLATPNNPEVLRAAITRDDLQGIKQIRAKKFIPQNGSTPSSPQVESPPLASVNSTIKSSINSDASDHSCSENSRNSSNHSISENGLDRTPESDRTHQKKPKSEAYLMTGDLILNLSRTSHDPSWLPQQKTVDDLRKSGSCSMPTSPNEMDSGSSRMAKHDVGSPQSLCSPGCAETNMNAAQFTYPPTSTSVRISRSEDHLQYQKDNMCAVNIELDEDVTSSLNTLLDTRNDLSPVPSSPTTPVTNSINNNSGDNDPRIVWTFNAPQISPPDSSAHSGHDSDSPLIRSPSPHSPLSPTSSMLYSNSGVYDKMFSGRDSLGSSNRSENICSNSSNLTSPDTDVPDELEWDDTTPTYIPTAQTNGYSASAKDKISNRHNLGVTQAYAGVDRVSDKVNRRDENRIVIKVAGPEKCNRENKKSELPSLSPLGHESRRLDGEAEGQGGGDIDLTPTNTPPHTPGSGTLSPETLAYQQLWESEDEMTCLSEEDGGNSGSGAKPSIRTSTAASPPLRTPSTTSPPLSEDESDIESLHSFHYSPKAIDLPSATRLAKRLYTLDGFKKSDVSRHLSKK